MKQILEYCYRENHTPITDIITGEVFCSDCGTVLIEKITDRSIGSTIYTENYMDKTQNGPPSKIATSDMSRSSVISKQNFDAGGNRLRAVNKNHFSRLRLWDSRSKKDNKEGNLVKAFTILDAFASKLNIPENAKEHTAYIYRKALENNLIRGNSILAVISGSVYVACKQLGIPRSADDIAKVANINKKKLTIAYKRLVNNLDLKIDSSDTNYLTKIGNSLPVSEKTKRLANKILIDAKEEKIHVGKNPLGITGASLYLSAINYDEHVPMVKISNVTNISVVTIRKMIKLLRPFAAKYIKSIDIGA
ncbi:MAG: transcription factor TFIIB [Nitrosopumilus sp.]|nr:transcription factor TFIIB [Nitrosopumilus sp.]